MATTLTPDEEKALGIIVRQVLMNPDLVDELAASIGEDISTDPVEAAYQVIMVAAVEPENFDSIVRNFDATENNFIGAAAAAATGAIIGAGKKIAGLFKNKEKSGAVKDWLKGTLGKAGTAIKNWKDNRIIKQELKNSGDPNWKDIWKGMKKDNTVTDLQADDVDDLGDGGDAVLEEPMTVGEFRSASETSSGSSVDPSTVIPAGVSLTEIEQALQLMDKQANSLKIWKFIGIGAAGALIVSLIFIFTGGFKPKSKAAK